jgi:Fe-S cluster biogenesis protein NfuA
MIPLLTFLLILSTAVLARDCFLMSGKNATASHQPCTPNLSSSEHSACCATATDTCLSSGLCIASTGLIYESGCTDPTWESDACPHVCPDASTNWRGSGSGNWTAGEERDYWQVMVCTAGVVCCRASSGDPDCCADQEGLVEFMPGKPVLAAADEEDEAGRTTVTRTVTATVSAVETGIRADETVDGGDSSVVDGSDSGDLAVSGTCTDCTKRETTVGAAVGASLGAALIGALGSVWFLLQRQKKLAATLGQYQAAAGQLPASSVASTGPINRNTAFRPFAELDAERKYELGTESSVSPS